MKMTKKKIKINQEGFTLIELMIVVAIIGILAAVAIPNFLGVQEKAKRRFIEEASTSAKVELHSWLDATLKQESGVIDLNGDGIVGFTELPAAALSNVPNSWINAFIAKKGTTPLSPWFSNIPLFTVSGAPLPGQIGFSRINANRTIQITGLDKTGNTLYHDSISID